MVRANTRPSVTYVNAGSEPETFSIERATWSDDALRPGMLLSFQEFRDLFSEDYIGADVKLAVGEQTVLFTDVVGSTAFYAARGIRRRSSRSRSTSTRSSRSSPPTAVRSSRRSATP